MAKTNAKSMVEGSPLKLIITFAIPLFLGNLFQQTYNMVDAAIVGQTLGASALGAVGCTSSVQFLILGFCMGACTGFTVPVAQRFGAQDYKEMHKYEYTAAIWSAVIAAILTVGTIVFCPAILRMLRVQDDIFAMARSYLTIIAAGIPFTILYNELSGMLRAIGDSRTPFLFLAFSSVLNIFLDLFCIMVLHWGVAGAAFATIASQAVSGLLCMFLIVRKFEILWIGKEEREMTWDRSRRVLTMAVPMGLQFSITAIGSMVMQSANNALGTIYVSGFAAGAKIKQFMMCPFTALATAVSTFASQNYGAGKADRIRKGIAIGLVTATVYAIFAGVIMGVFGRTMSMLFVTASSAEVLDASALYVRRMGMFWWLLGFLDILRLTMQGLGFANRAMYAGAVEMVARIAVATIFVPIYGFDAITFADQCAWAGGVLYTAPVCIYTLRQIFKEIEAGKVIA